jgi:DeoR family fructose operon transcriptional repressor
MFAEERRAKILEMVHREQRVLAKDLADLFQLSIDSIRRDLSIMEEQGLLKKTHGGAIPANQVRVAPLPPDLRYGDGSAHENAISKQAASYVQPNDTVFIGGAGIHYGILRYLPRTFPITIITNSMKIAEATRDWEHIETYFIGGKVKPSGNITDSLANEWVRQFTIDLCFLTGGGVSAKGISTSTPEAAGFTRTISEVSRRKIGLAPHNKLGTDAFAKAVSIQSIDLLITDEEAAKETIEKIESKGVQVIVARIEAS